MGLVQVPTVMGGATIVVNLPGVESGKLKLDGSTLADIMRDKQAPAAARVSASTQILNRGWGQAPQTIALTEVPAVPDLSSLTDEQLEALATLRALAPLAGGIEGSC
jgi:hypothetical protein